MVTDNIINSINIVVEKIYKSVEGQVYELLDKITLISPEILKNEPLSKIYEKDGTSIFMTICVSLITFYCVYYMFTRLVAMYDGNKSESLYKFVIKLIMIVTLMGSSLFIVETILNINYLMTSAISSIGEEITGHQISFNSLKEQISDLDKYMKQDFISLDGMIKSFIAFGAVSLLVNFAVRYVTIIFLILIAPFGIMFMASQITGGISKAWFKLFITSITTQIIVQLILIIPLSFKDTNTVVFKIILVGSIYILYRLNSFVKDILGNIVDIKR